jgi:hypothetical protein
MKFSNDVGGHVAPVTGENSISSYQQTLSEIQLCFIGGGLSAIGAAVLHVAA